MPSGQTLVAGTSSGNDPKWLVNFAHGSYGGASECTEAYIDFFSAGTAVGSDYGFSVFTGVTDTTTKGVATFTGTYIWGSPEEIPGLVDLEVRDTTDMSDVTGVKVFIIGR